MAKKNHTQGNNDMIGDDKNGSHTVNAAEYANEILDIMDMVEWHGKGSYLRILKFINIKHNPKAVHTFYKKHMPPAIDD